MNFDDINDFINIKSRLDILLRDYYDTYLHNPGQRYVNWILGKNGNNEFCFVIYVDYCGNDYDIYANYERYVSFDELVNFSHYGYK